MPEIFARSSTKLAGAFSADLGRLSFGTGVSTALVQNVNATYMQNVTRLYEVGTADFGSNVYYVGGRTQGSLAIARVIGPSSVLQQYYQKFGNVCRAKTNTIELVFDPLDCDGAMAVYSCKYCVIVQIGVSVAAQDMVVNENSQLMFSSMEYTQGPSNLINSL